MALLGCECWDIYGINNVEDYFQTLGGVAGTTTEIQAGEGRCESAALYNSTIGGGPVMAVAAATNSGYVAWALKLAAFNTLDRLTIDHTAAYSGSITFLSIKIPLDGRVQVWRGSTFGAVLLDETPAGQVLLNVYNHFAVDFLISPTVGYVRVKMNGVLVLSYDGDVTPPGYAVWIGFLPQWSLIRWSPLGWIDDLYWGDTSGAAPWNASMGDLRVEGQLALTDAEQAGSLDDFTRSTGSDTGALLDENPPNDDTDYIYSDTPGHRTTVAFPSLTGSGEVFGYQVMVHAKKSDASSSRTIRPLVEHGGSYHEGPAYGVGDSAYTYYESMHQINPGTGVQWLEADVNASEAGVDLDS